MSTLNAIDLKGEDSGESYDTVLLPSVIDTLGYCIFLHRKGYECQGRRLGLNHYLTILWYQAVTT